MCICILVECVVQRAVTSRFNYKYNVALEDEVLWEEDVSGIRGRSFAGVRDHHHRRMGKHGCR
jgi:hypothetical protein